MLHTGRNANVDKLAARIGQIAEARVVVGHERYIAQPKILAEAFVIAEEERLVLLDRAAKRSAKLVALELGSGPLIEEIARVEIVIAQKLIYAAVHFVSTRGGHDTHLSPR